MEIAELNPYTTSLLPAYSSHILKLFIANTNNSTGETCKLAKFAMERCIQIYQRIIHTEQIDRLLQNPKKSHYAKD